MPMDLGGLGMQAASTAIGTGFGLLLEGHNDRRQLKQQGKLQELQIKGQKEMTDYNKEKELQMWKDTNYPAQMAMLKEAGLNAGLLYGKSGGGGVTTGSATGNVSGSSAPSGGREVMDSVGMGMQMQQMALLKAQKENIEADTENKKATATKTAGVDTEIGKQQVGNMKLDGEMKAMQNEIMKATTTEQIIGILNNTEIGGQTLNKMYRENRIGKETENAVVDEIKATAIGAAIKNELMKAQINLTNEQAQKIGNDISLGWSQLDNEKQKTKIQEAVMKFTTNGDQRTYDNILKAVKTVTGAFKPVSITTE